LNYNKKQMSRDTQMEENTYAIHIECDLDYLVRLDLLDNIPFKYIKDYLPFEEIPVVDFEYTYLNFYEYHLQ